MVRIGWVSLKRVSATIRKTASAEQKVSLVNADGPCRKNGGGVRSRVPSCVIMGWSGTAGRRGRQESRPRGSRASFHASSHSLGGEDRAQALHALERHSAAAHDAGQRV